MPQPDLEERLSALSSLTDPTRKALYDHVRSRGRPVSRDEAAAATGLSRSLAAYHLDRLAASGLLDVRFERPEGRGGPGAGRPAKLYSRRDEAVEASVPDRDYKLAALIFAEALASDSSGAVRGAVVPVARRVGNALVSDAPAAPASGPSGSAVETLARLGYEPYEDEPGTVRLRNCPFDDLVDEHQELACTMNLGLIEGVLEGIGDQAHRASLAPGEGHCCVAVVADRAGAADEAAVELLSDDEEADLEQEARRVVDQHAGGSMAPEASEELARQLASEAEETYLSARVSGLCREGALELFADAVRSALAAIGTEPARQS